MPFVGIISGLAINSVKILDLTAAEDKHITIIGDVRILPYGNLVDQATPLQRMQQVRHLKYIT